MKKLLPVDKKTTYTLLHGDCRKYLFDYIKPDSVDLTVTSPPYDNLRSYGGSRTWGWAEFAGIAAGLWRVTRLGGVVVWVVNDEMVKGSETGTSFGQALFFKECGFNLHDTMIWSKGGLGAVGSHSSYLQDFEYMFVFVKGKVKTFNLIRDRKNKNVGTKHWGTGGRDREGKSVKSKTRIVVREEFGKRFNVWQMYPSNPNLFHRAVFPEQLAHDHIVSWSNKGDVVLDPMMGSGTTGRMARLLSRNFIGIEIDKEYFKAAKGLIETCCMW